MDYADILSPKVVQPLKDVVSPPGFTEKTPKKSVAKKLVNLDDLKTKKAWEIAIGPAKSIPMNLIMSYMTGNSLQLIPIMMTMMLFLNPLKAIFTDTNKVFNNLQTNKNGSVIVQAKVVFVLCQLACMSIGIWKLNLMGLIPNSEGDWLSFKTPAFFPEKLVTLPSRRFAAN